MNMEPMVTDGVNVGVMNHETIGAKFLKELNFPDIICDIVQGHVNVKRYLVYINPEYYQSNLFPLLFVCLFVCLFHSFILSFSFTICPTPYNRK